MTAEYNAERASLEARARHQIWIANNAELFSESERIAAERHAGYLIQLANDLAHRSPDGGRKTSGP